MKNIVWPAGTHDSTFFSGMLLMSSTHLDGINSGQTSFVTTALKLEAVKQVRERVQRLTPENIVGCIGAVACMAICGLVSDPGWRGGGRMTRLPSPLEALKIIHGTWMSRLLTSTALGPRWKGRGRGISASSLRGRDFDFPGHAVALERKVEFLPNSLGPRLDRLVSCVSLLSDAFRQPL
jgi:hypothetical protein